MSGPQGTKSPTHVSLTLSSRAPTVVSDAPPSKMQQWGYPSVRLTPSRKANIASGSKKTVAPSFISPVGLRCPLSPEQVFTS